MNLLRFILLSFSLLCFQQGTAQVGIQTDNPQATLDISSGNTIDFNDGLLIPRVAAFSAVNPGVEQNGMLVFLTTTSAGNTSGFYYWNHASTSWDKLGEGNGSFWSQGTLNGRPYIFYQDAQTTNNIPIRIFEDGYLGIGTSTLPQERIELKFENENNIQIASSNPENSSKLIFYNQNGTFNSPDYLRTDEVLGGIIGKTWDGTDASEEIASIKFKGSETQSEDNLPTKIDFAVTRGGQAESTVQMSLESDGELRLNPLNSTNNVANNGVRPVPVYANANGGLTLNGDSQILVEPSVKFTNSDTTTNLNISPATPAGIGVGINLPILGNLLWNDDTTLFQVGTSTQVIRINEAGRYNVVSNIYFSGNAPGTSLECYIVINPADGSPDYVASSIYANSYIGGSFNHSLSSISINEDIQVSAGDVLSVRVKGNGNSNATILMPTVNTSMFQLTKIR